MSPNPVNLEILDEIHESKPVHLEILDGNYESKPVDSTGRLLGRWKNSQLSSALQESNKWTESNLIYWLLLVSDSLIGPIGLLLG